MPGLVLLKLEGCKASFKAGIGLFFCEGTDNKDFECRKLHILCLYRQKIITDNACTDGCG